MGIDKVGIDKVGIDKVGIDEPAHAVRIQYCKCYTANVGIADIAETRTDRHWKACCLLANHLVSYWYNMGHLIGNGSLG